MAECNEQTEAGTLKNDIQNIIDALNTHHRNVNISRVTGSSVAIATGVPAAACAIAAPFTLGVTLIPAIVLGIIAAVGGGVSVGATVTEYFMKKQKVKEVQEKWEIFYHNFFANEDFEDARGHHRNSNPRTSDFATIDKDAVKGAAEFVRTSGRISSAVVCGTLRSTAAGVRITAPLLAAASVVALPLDIVDLVTASLALHRGEQSTATESLMHIVTFLDRVANNYNNNDNNSNDGSDEDNGNGENDDQDNANDNYDDIELLLDYDNDDDFLGSISPSVQL